MLHEDDGLLLWKAKQMLRVTLQLLAVLVDWDDEDDGEYRFLVDGKDTKYVTVEPGVLPKDNQTFGPILIPLPPPFPPGEWNEGHVSKNPLSGQPVFSHYTQSDLPAISNTWHHMRIDHLEFKQVRQLRQNIHVVTHPRFDQTLAVKFAEFPWQMPYFEAETTAYEWPSSHGIGPKFIANLTEASQRCNEKQELEAEYEQLEASLSDTSTRGVPYTWEDQQAFQQTLIFTGPSAVPVPAFFSVVISMTSIVGGSSFFFNDAKVVDSGNSALYTCTLDPTKFATVGITMPSAKDLAGINALMKPFLDNLTKIDFQYQPRVIRQL
ncbi:hypothetical protein V8C40DRAFT_264748 [Trichoderma camerunense]